MAMPMVHFWILAIEYDALFESAGLYLSEKSLKEAIHDRIDLRLDSEALYDDEEALTPDFFMEQYEVSGDEWFIEELDLKFTIEHRSFELKDLIPNNHLLTSDTPLSVLLDDEGGED